MKPSDSGAGTSYRLFAWVAAHCVAMACGASVGCFSPGRLDTFIEICVVLDIGICFVMLRYCWDYPATVSPHLSVTEIGRLKERMETYERRTKRRLFAYTMLAGAVVLGGDWYPVAAGAVMGFMAVNPYGILEEYKALAVFKMDLAERAREEAEQARRQQLLDMSGTKPEASG